MNSRQRRKRNRGFTSPPPPNTNRKATEAHKPNIWRSWLIPRLVWAAILGVATLVGLIQLKPSISVEPYSSQDPHNPFTEQFSLQNNSAYKIQNIESRCGIINVRAENVSLQNFSVMYPGDTPGHLQAGAKTTITCRLDQLVGMTGRYKSLEIGLMIKFKVPLGISECKESRFNGLQTTDGNYIWTYRNSEDCFTTR